MELENIIYPGFNKTLSELNALSKVKKKSSEIVDLTEIEYTDAKQSNCQNAAGEKFIFPSHKSIQALLDSVIHVGQDFRCLDLPH